MSPNGYHSNWALGLTSPLGFLIASIFAVGDCFGSLSPSLIPRPLPLYDDRYLHLVADTAAPHSPRPDSTLGQLKADLNAMCKVSPHSLIVVIYDHCFKMADLVVFVVSRVGMRWIRAMACSRCATLRMSRRCTITFANMSKPSKRRREVLEPPPSPPTLLLVCFHL